MKRKPKVIILGAGPAGLGAGLELVNKKATVSLLEKEDQVGGISKTINYKGYYFDCGGHRFFTKSKEIMDLWKKTLGDDFLKRDRLSRIYYKNKFFFYPLKPANALFNLGLGTAFSVLFSYLKGKFLPKRNEDTFEKWVSNRFGEKLYQIYFKTYTEKLWGIPCDQISAKWAAQRIKGLSLTSAIKNAFFPDETGKIKTLIHHFQYPKYGPGMMYQKIADKIKKKKGKVLLDHNVKQILHENNKVIGIKTQSKNRILQKKADHFISTLPLPLLIKMLKPSSPAEVVKSAENLNFRSFLVANIILNVKDVFPDNWLYIHSPEVKLGRIQNYKNWSQYMAKDSNFTHLGLEYFCTQGDEFWERDDREIISLGLMELEKIKIAKAPQFVDGFVVRVPNAYPVYAMGYEEHLERIKDYLSQFKNLQTAGRGGMFRYNNMDHSLLSGIYAARNILGSDYDIWGINIEDEYHEEVEQS